MPTLNIAHRGGAGLWPENSLAAFRNAVAMGADGAELDIHLTKDGEVVVFHDYRLKPEIVRDASGNYLGKPSPRIKDLTLAELGAYDIGRHDRSTPYGSRQPELKPIDGERVPTLGAVLEVCKTAKKPFWLQVELKTSWTDRDVGADPLALAEAAVAVLKKHDYLDRAIFVGFDWPGLLHVKKISNAKCWFTTMNLAWFRDGLVPEDDPVSEPMRKMLRNWADTGTSPWAGGFDASQHGGSIQKAIKAAGGDGWFPTLSDATPEAVAEAKSLGLKVGAWTVDAPADMKRLIGLGLDAICTDRPDVLATVLKETA
ncbi:MAG TPA: glycerophosphodiester phosphodiesterase family protein [Rhizomicrobium sp.]|nr:glycerophosphodiester phosphodiesterase family protein [Rhizomicrobium sp.]